MQESDRNIKGKGTKHDDLKPRMELVPMIAVEKVARVMTFGAKKYGEYNWMQGLSGTRLVGAILRHLTAWLDGVDEDGESGLPTIAHAAANCLMLVELQRLHPQETDDRSHVTLVARGRAKGRARRAQHGEITHAQECSCMECCGDHITHAEDCACIECLDRKAREVTANAQALRDAGIASDGKSVFLSKGKEGD